MAKAVISGENSKADLFFPIAPAMWRMRAQSSFRDLPTGYAPRNFYADYAHICEGLPCYAAACTIVESILKYYNHEGISVSNDDLVPNYDFVNEKNIPWTNWKNNQVCGVSSNWDTNKQAAITAAKESVNEINKVLSGILDINNWTYAGNNNKFYVTVKAVGCDVYLGTIRSGAFNTTYTINNGDSRTFECSMYSSSFDFYIAHSGSVTSTETSKLIFSDGSEVEYYPWNTQNSSTGIDIPQGGNHRITYPIICYNAEYTVTCDQPEDPITPPEGNTIESFTANGVSFNMISIKGDTFLMGTPATQTGSGTNERPQHFVTVSDYKIGQTEVTQELWVAVMGSNPSAFPGDPQRPVDNVSWEMCQEFIDSLNRLTGMNFRFPTEAEWEFAAKGGNQSKGYIFAGSNTPAPVAWYSTNSGSKTQPVAQKEANELGLYDMSGNVEEWCQDWYKEYQWYVDNYTQPIIDPVGPETGSFKPLRGGSWAE